MTFATDVKAGLDPGAEPLHQVPHPRRAELPRGDDIKLSSLSPMKIFLLVVSKIRSIFYFIKYKKCFQV
jgi:hypothetical protein